MKYTKLYQTKTAATGDLNAVAPHISYCVESSQILNCAGTTDAPVEIVEESGILKARLKPQDAAVGDWLFSDLTHGSEIGSKTPIGICVAPKSHFSDGKNRFMSLVNMSLVDPEHGTTATGNDSSNPGAGIRWGKNGQQDTTHMSDSILPYMNFEALKQGNYVYSGVQQGSAYLASDSYAVSGSGVDPYDGDSGYLNYPGISGVYSRVDSDAGSGSWEPVVYPYLADGTKNTDYTGNINLYGKEDSATLLSKQVLDWSVATTFEARNTVTGDANYPAAKVCSLFAPVASTLGQWYLPSAGELGYTLAKVNYINTRLATLGSSAVCIGMLGTSTFSTDSLGYYLWSSSEASEYYAWRLNTNRGNLDSTYGKASNGTGYRVRAFLAL